MDFYGLKQNFKQTSSAEQRMVQRNQAALDPEGLPYEQEVFIGNRWEVTWEQFGVWEATASIASL